MQKDLLERISINPKIMSGKPVIKGTRITIEIVIEKLADGATIPEILEDYPFLTKEDIQACLKYVLTKISSENIA